MTDVLGAEHQTEYSSEPADVEAGRHACQRPEDGCPQSEFWGAL